MAKRIPFSVIFATGILSHNHATLFLALFFTTSLCNQESLPAHQFIETIAIIYFLNK